MSRPGSSPRETASRATGLVHRSGEGPGTGETRTAPAERCQVSLAGANPATVSGGGLILLSRTGHHGFAMRCMANVVAGIRGGTMRENRAHRRGMPTMPMMGLCRPDNSRQRPDDPRTGECGPSSCRSRCELRGVPDSYYQTFATLAAASQRRTTSN